MSAGRLAHAGRSSDLQNDLVLARPQDAPREDDLIRPRRIVVSNLLAIHIGCRTMHDVIPTQHGQTTSLRLRHVERSLCPNEACLHSCFV